MKYRFIVLEGADASGKTGLRTHLFQTLHNNNIDILNIISFSWLIPECTKVITEARHLGYQYSSEELTDAYVRDKEALCRRIIKPHLTARHVASDRYIASDMVYNMVMWGIEPERTCTAYKNSSVLRPDLTVFVDTPPEIAYDRLMKRLDGSSLNQHPWEKMEKQKKIYAAFQEVLFGDTYPWLKPVVKICNSGSFDRTIAQFEREVLSVLLDL